MSRARQKFPLPWRCRFFGHDWDGHVDLEFYPRPACWRCAIRYRSWIHPLRTSAVWREACRIVRMIRWRQDEARVRHARWQQAQDRQVFAFHAAHRPVVAERRQPVRITFTKPAPVEPAQQEN